MYNARYYGVGLDEFRHSQTEIDTLDLADRSVFAKRLKECEAIAQVGFFEPDQTDDERRRRGEFHITRNHFLLFARDPEYRGWYLEKYPHDPVYMAFRAVIPSQELAMGPVIGIQSGIIAICCARQLQERSRRLEAMKRAIFGSREEEVQSSILQKDDIYINKKTRPFKEKRTRKRARNIK